ncbi:MAG TPA: CoA transferase, partial [Nevskiaceae bacterium]|nr:CoA transferase [Nevskiaceae bacterium]
GPYSSLPTHGHQMNALVGGTPAEMGSDGLVHPVRGRAWMGGTETAAPGPSQAAPYAALAAVSAVLRGRRTGEGAYLDVSAADSVLAASWVGAVYNFNHDRIREFVGLNARDVPHIEDEGAGSARYQLYQTRDGKLILFCAIEPKFWRNFCKAVGRDDLIDAPPPADGPVDFGHGQTGLRRTLQSIFSTRTLDEWMRIAVEHDIAMGPAHRIEDVPTDPQIAARGILHDEHHPDAGVFTAIGYPLRVDGTGYGTSRPAPQLAQGGREVLAELGLDAAELDRLVAAGVIALR